MNYTPEKSALLAELAAKKTYYLNRFAEVLAEPDLEKAELQHEQTMAEIQNDFANYAPAIEAELETLKDKPELQKMLR